MRILHALVWASLGGLGAWADQTPPRLAVVISVDQMRADYFERFGPYFGADGFNRLTSQGAWFQNCHYQHALTITAPGHATILSGVNANVHGVIANDWKESKTLIDGNSVEDVSSPLVGITPQGPQAAKSGRSPRNFLGTTVGDRLKERYGAKAKVFGVADKDRSAILMSGARADGAYWGEDARFVTSTYYRRELPDWVKAFNAAHPPEADYGRIWDRLLDPALYDKVQGPDRAVGEYTGKGDPTGTFPKRMDGGAPGPTPDFLWALDYAPWNNDFVVEFAEKLIEVEQLGADETPDLLCVGFSQTDRVGHSYGPDSHEVMDSYLRLDRTIAGFLSFLDTKIGRKNYVVVLTADHGVGSIPEQVRQKQGAAAGGRIEGAKLVAHVKSALEAAFGPPPADSWWVIRDSGGFRLNPRALEAKNLSPARAAGEIRQALLTFPGIAAAWTREQMLGREPLGDYGERMRLSYHAERSPDVVFMTRPNWLVGTTPASHGTPYEYDSHVPQLWFGAGIRPGARTEPVAVEDIAPTLAALLGVTLPPEAKGKRLFSGATSNAQR
jgi:hypothetical protein